MKRNKIYDTDINSATNLYYYHEVSDSLSRTISAGAICLLKNKSGGNTMGQNQAVKVVARAVETSMICSEDGANTYVVRKNFKGREGNKALIIQLYPTLTENDIDAADNTMLHLLNHLNDLNLKEVVFANLFSKVCKSRPSIKQLEVDYENLNQLKQIMLEPDFKDWKVIIAWGSSMSSNVIAGEMKRSIIQMYKEIVPDGVLWQLTADDIYMKNEKAVHVLYMGIRHKTSVWKLEKFQDAEYLKPIAKPDKGEKKGKKPVETIFDAKKKVLSMAAAEKEKQTVAEALGQEARADV